MKKLFDEISSDCSRLVTRKYSTSFSLAVKMLSPTIRGAIYNIYGFVRFADEIVDSFHSYDKERLIKKFESDYYEALEEGISLNPILNAFQQTVSDYQIPNDLVQAFLKSMKADLHKAEYKTQKEYEDYIYGSAGVVGIMCLKVFVDGDDVKYEQLKQPAMRLGSAFQKVNFLRDLKDDFENLDRSYFPNIDLKDFNNQAKIEIIREIEEDFEVAFREGVIKLPVEAKFGVYVAYRYYKRLLKKIHNTPSSEILETRIRISNPMKINLLARSFVKYKLNLI